MFPGSRVALVAVLSLLLVIPQWLVPAVAAACPGDYPGCDIDPSTGCCKPKPKTKSTGHGKKTGGTKKSSAPTAPAGESDGECYPNGTCNSGLTCNRRNRCVRPGVAGGPCLSGNSCEKYLRCSAGTCNAIAQGDPGGQCYGNNTCNKGSICIDGNTMCEDQKLIEQREEAERKRRAEELRIQQLNEEERLQAELERRQRDAQRQRLMASLQLEYDAHVANLTSHNAARVAELGAKLSKIDQRIAAKSRTIDKTRTSYKALYGVIVGGLFAGFGGLMMGIAEDKEDKKSLRQGGVALLATGGVIGGVSLLIFGAVAGSGAAATKRRASLESERATLEGERQRLLATPSFLDWATANGHDLSEF